MLELRFSRQYFIVIHSLYLSNRVNWLTPCQFFNRFYTDVYKRQVVHGRVQSGTQEDLARKKYLLKKNSTNLFCRTWFKPIILIKTQHKQFAIKFHLISALILVYFLIRWYSKRTRKTKVVRKGWKSLLIDELCNW